MRGATADTRPDPASPWSHLLPRVERITDGPVPVRVWDIPYTIPQLGYATHGHFRYYGKFPSSVAAQVLERFPPPRPGQYVLDNFCGSGTTLVEARLRGIPAFGIDISWIAVLASRVKARAVDLESVRALKDHMLAGLPEAAPLPADRFRDKWFSPEAAGRLAALKSGLAALQDGPEKDFLILAFLAIVRRVSFAHDGEVRPHIDGRKTPKEVLRAFDKKVSGMISGHEAFMAALRGDARSDAYVMDNRALSARFADGGCYLAVSHPPYLNSFAYGPVFSLEYYWGAGLHPLEGELPAARERELRAWPATDTLVERYYGHLDACYRETHAIQQAGGLLAVVIGDCTRHKVLEPVIEKTIGIVSGIGYRLLERNYRTTHYGLGKYAYDFRAGYHGASQKRDGIFVFAKE